MSKWVGWRKLLVVLLAIAAATFVSLNENQANVLIAAIVAFNGANAIEHVSGNAEQIRASFMRILGRGDSAAGDVPRAPEGDAEK